MTTKAEVIEAALLTPEEIKSVKFQASCDYKPDRLGLLHYNEYSEGKLIKGIEEKVLAKLLDLKQPCSECGGQGEITGADLGMPTNATAYFCEVCHGTGLSDLPVVGILKADQTFPDKIKEHLDAAPDYLKETVVESPRDLYLKYLGGYEAQHDMFKAGFRAMEE